MPETMSVNGRKDFENWHAQQVSDRVHFDFSKELIKYCKSDVKLLNAGCLKFKALFEEESKFDLFNQMTIASACNQDLCQNRTLPNRVTSEPLCGWRMSSNHSKVALEWLLWQDSKFPEPRIRHAGNVGEYRIPNSRYILDD